MAFLPGFEYDIFISYSHVDNLSVGEAVPWVKRFHEALEVSLAQRVGRVGLVKIWRDERLDGNQLFDLTIQNAIEKSALFLALTSNGYLASDYCQKELSWFDQKARESRYGQKTGDRLRISNVLLNNLPHQDWPEELGRVSGYKFNDAESSDDLGLPSDPLEKLFRKQLRKLTDSLYETLLEFQERFERPTADSSPKGPRVYLADVADSLRSRRNRIKQELERKNIQVEESIPPPYEAEQHDERVKQALAETTLSVHLLDQFGGREIQGLDGTTYPQRQVQLAGESSHSDLLWIPRGLSLDSVEDLKQRDFLNQLENGDRAGRSYDFVRGEPASLVPQIMDLIEELNHPKKKENGQRAVLLDTHVKDQLHAYELGQFFLQNDIQPFINPQEDDPTRNMDILEARLKAVTMLMILFGEVSEQWVRQRLGAALQLSVVKGLPIKSFCVFSVPPEKGQASPSFSVGPIEVPVLDNSHSQRVDPSLLRPLVEGVTVGGHP